MSFYQPAHAPSLSKHNKQVYEFDSPTTIAKQQWQEPRSFVQAGGAPSSSFSSAPIPPPLPQLAYKTPSRRWNLKTRDWSNQPWKTQNLKWQGDSYMPPASLTNKSLSNSRIPMAHPSNLPSFGQTTSAIPSSGYSSGLPTANYQPISTIPLSHNYHLPSSGLARSTSANDLSINKDTWNNNNNWNNSSNIPSAPAWTGFKFGSWRKNRTRSMKPLRTRNWGTRNGNGWSGFNNHNVLNESFFQNRPHYAPVAPRLPSFLATQRKWKSGPYKQRPLRTRSWGNRGENGWSNFNQGLYQNESALPFMQNRQKWIDQEKSERSERSERSLQSSAPIEQSSYQQPIQSFVPVQSFQQPIIQQQSIAPIAAAPLAAAPLGAPLTGRKGRRAAKKAARQQAIQNKLTTELNPPNGDPAVNHYRRGAKATVPLAGPAIAGLAPPTGSLGSRRVGRKNNLGPRRGRLAGPVLPVPATQPPLAGSGIVAPVVAQGPSIVPLNANSSAFTPLAGITHAPSFGRAATSQGLVNTGLPLSSAPMTSVPMTAQGQFLEKQFVQPTVLNARPTGSATF